MKLKFSTTFLLTALCLSGSQLYAADAGAPYKLNSLLKGQSQLAEQLELLANCTNTLQREIEDKAATQGGDLSTALPATYPGSSGNATNIPPGCSLVMSAVSVNPDGILVINTPTAPANSSYNSGTSTALYNQVFQFFPYIDAGNTAYSNTNAAPVGIAAWKCSYTNSPISGSNPTNPGQSVNLKVANIFGTTTNILAAAPLPLASC